MNTEELSLIKRKIEENFYIYDLELHKDFIRFYVFPKFGRMSFEMLVRMFPEYKIDVGKSYDLFFIDVKKERERIFLNVILFLATIASTTLIGSTFYGKFDIVGGFIFSIAVMLVLGSHEMGHYLIARKWKMKTSLPYFIPFPTIIGTLGAVIKYKGIIPNRKALFDVGVAGPLAGVVASIFILYIGLRIPFNPEFSSGEIIILGDSVIFLVVAKLAGFESGRFMHPIAFAGWIGLFVTFINLIPVGQLDGGHILRAMLGRRAEVVSKITPFLLITTGFLLKSQSRYFWIMWGLLTMFFSLQPHPGPADDETPLDLKRYIIGILTFCLGLACFTPDFIRYSRLT